MNKIEYVSADMSTAYKSGVEECFPNAKLIIDVFHLDKWSMWQQIWPVTYE